MCVCWGGGGGDGGGGGGMQMTVSPQTGCVNLFPVICAEHPEVVLLSTQGKHSVRANSV